MMSLNRSPRLLPRSHLGPTRATKPKSPRGSPARAFSKGTPVLCGRPFYLPPPMRQPNIWGRELLSPSLYDGPGPTYKRAWNWPAQGSDFSHTQGVYRKEFEHLTTNTHFHFLSTYGLALPRIGRIIHRGAYLSLQEQPFRVTIVSTMSEHAQESSASNPGARQAKGTIQPPSGMPSGAQLGMPPW